MSGELNEAQQHLTQRQAFAEKWANKVLTLDTRGAVSAEFLRDFHALPVNADVREMEELETYMAFVARTIEPHFPRTAAEILTKLGERTAL